MWLGALGMAMSFGGVSMCLAQSNPGPTAMTQSGRVRGTLEHGINVFRGIPYGAPTGGANRFHPAKHPASWSGTREATAFGDRCPQIAAPTTAAWSSCSRSGGSSAESPTDTLARWLAFPSRPGCPPGPRGDEGEASSGPVATQS